MARLLHALNANDQRTGKKRDNVLENVGYIDKIQQNVISLREAYIVHAAYTNYIKCTQARYAL